MDRNKILPLSIKALWRKPFKAILAFLQHTFSQFSLFQCSLCRTSCSSQLCVSCALQLRRIDSACQTCGETLPLGNTPLSPHLSPSICGRCLQKPTEVCRVVTAFQYKFPTNKLISDFKHHKNHTAGAALLLAALPVFRKHLDSLPSNEHPQLLIPVPLHWRRQLSRGFNQASVISHKLSESLSIPTKSLVTRKNSAIEQKQLNRKQRLINLKGAFTLKNQNVLEGVERVAIIDDVITTGATGDMLAKLIKQAGVPHVELWALAKTLSK